MTAIKKQTDRGHPGENWTYTSFSEPELSARLSQMAGAGSQDRTDWVSFQPCLNPDQSTQDRFVLADWQLEGGAWSFRAVFDGEPLCTFSIVSMADRAQDTQDTKPPITSSSPFLRLSNRSSPLP